MNKNIFVAGHKGMVGSSLTRKLLENDDNIFTAERSDLDLTNQKELNKFFLKNKINHIYLAAAKVGGILANDNYPAEFIYQNLQIQMSVIHSAYTSGVGSLLFLGSSCIYPKLAKQPMNEDMLLTGKLEDTNEPYAIAKIAGIKMCESYNRQYGTDFRCVMPTNLYGPRDNFNLENSHVIPALISKFHHAKKNDSKVVEVWGTGQAKREFIHVDDLADACIFIMNINKKDYQKFIPQRNSHVNIGSGEDISIKELANLVAEIVGFSGKILFDKNKPDGTPRKVLDVGLIESLGWKNKINLRRGIETTFKMVLR